MTQHNLDIHVSWLLSSKVTQPVDVPAIVPTFPPLTTQIEKEKSSDEVRFEGVACAPPGAAHNRHTSEPENVNFVRPSFSTLDAANPQQLRSVRDESMGRLASAERSRRPGLISQHQLATPTSTTSSTAASNSSLTKGYADFLREKNGNHSSNAATDRLLPRHSKSIQTPQTPRQKPRPTIEWKLEAVESVDLTGDDQVEDLNSRSSSAEVLFGESKVLWAEDSASRAEPILRSSKKRKSDELSGASPRRGGYGAIIKSAEVMRGDVANMDGYVDIVDDVPHPDTTRRKPKGRAVEQKNVVQAAESDFEQAYEATKSSFGRAKTLGYKSSSRVASILESGMTKSESPLEGRQLEPSTTLSRIASKKQSVVQVARSPTPLLKISSASSSLPPSQKRQKSRRERTIQDSEDDDEVMCLDGSDTANCSASSPLKQSPLTKGTRRRNIPASEPMEPLLHDVGKTMSRVGSPLRPISSNFFREDSVPIPLPKSSPSKTLSASQQLKHSSSEPTPPSTLGIDDKKLVALYLANPDTLHVYYQRVSQLKIQNALEAMPYVDHNQCAPAHLLKQRREIVDMDNAYSSLADLRLRHRTMMTEKKSICHKIVYLRDGDDGSAYDDRLLVLQIELRNMEGDIGHLLHKSGAIKDGFGTGIDSNEEPLPLKSPTFLESLAPLPSASSTIGSSSVIMQTQFPSVHQRPMGGSISHTAEDNLPKPSPKHVLANEPSCINPTLPHQVRRTPRSLAEEPYANTEIAETYSQGSIRQPNFYHEPSLMDDDFEDDTYDFEHLVQEAEVGSNSSRRDLVSQFAENENYGESDDDDMLEFAEEVEKRQSFTAPVLATSSSRKILANLQPSKEDNSTKKNMYSYADSHAAMLNFPWSRDVKKVLRDRFGLRGFRQNQLDAINAALGGKDAFVLMPTGGGKSLCYQLPAVVQSGKTRGVTVVISPLLSLMADQVDHLQKRHIQAFLLNGEKAKAERDLVYDALKQPYPDQYIQVLYITPEMIGKSKALMSALEAIHRRNKLARIVVDEAHCVSQWGHDFRPDYKTIVNVRRQFPGVPFMALTATATENVKADVIHNLGMDGCKEFKQSFNRPNLYYEVRSKKGKGSTAAVLEDMAELILNNYAGQTGIVYTLSRNGCEDLSKKLQDKGIKAHYFHANMPPNEKTSVQRDWQAGKWQVVVATIAFGMGIDKPDVRFVIHHTLPKSLEGYYQETGRAGRDGKPSRCFLYYGYQDTAVLKRFIDESEGSEEVKDRQREMLKKMVGFAENRTDCRRANILAYFGESFSKEECHHSCDNCNSDAVFEAKDMSRIAQDTLRIVKQLQKNRVTLIHALDILRGSTASKIKSQGHDNLDEYGCAKDLARGEVERLFTRLLMENALQEYSIVNKSGFATQYIQLGPNCHQFLSGRRRLNLMVKVSASPSAGLVSVPKISSKKPVPPTSTALTSPISPTSMKQKSNKRHVTSVRDRQGGEDGDFAVSEDSEESDCDAFGSPRHPTNQRRRLNQNLGPPITSDDRMKDLPEIHRDAVYEFVHEAKKLEETIRNRNGHSKRYFTECDFREMAIQWSLSLEDMKDLRGIDIDKVNRYGKKFLPLIKKFHSNYDMMMNPGEEKYGDMDPNHKDVIDLVSGDDSTDGEDDMSEVQESSRFFKPSAQVQQWNAQMLEAQQLPQRSHENTELSVPSSRGGFSARGKSRWSKKAGSRKSSGSTSASNTYQSGGGRGKNSFGVQRKAPTGRKSSGTSKKSSSSVRPGRSNSERSLGQGGRGSGSGSGNGGIFAMPTY